MLNAEENSYLRQLHEAHKARQSRMRAASLKVMAAEKKPVEPVKQAPVENPFERERKRLWRESWRHMIVLAEKKQAKRMALLREGHITEGEEPSITFSEIMAQVAAKYGLTVHDLKSHVRTRGHLMQARFEAWWRGRRETLLSHPQMGRLTGNRDHTSVLNGVRQYEAFRTEMRGGPQAYEQSPLLGTALGELVIMDD